MGQEPVAWLAGAVRILVRRVDELQQALPQSGNDKAVDESRIQVLIEEAQKSQFLVIVGAVRESLAEVVKKEDLARLSTHLMQQSKEGLSKMSLRIEEMEVAQRKLKEVQDSQFALTIDALRASLADVMKTTDLDRLAVDLKKESRVGVEAMSKRVSALEAVVQSYGPCSGTSSATATPRA